MSSLKPHKGLFILRVGREINTVEVAKEGVIFLPLAAVVCVYSILAAKVNLVIIYLLRKRAEHFGN